jgi:hypothetical protein
MQSNIKFKLNQEITSLAHIRATSDLLIVANGSHSIVLENKYQLNNRISYILTVVSRQLLKMIKFL